MKISQVVNSRHSQNKNINATAPLTADQIASAAGPRGFGARIVQKMAASKAAAVPAKKGR